VTRRKYWRYDNTRELTDGHHSAAADAASRGAGVARTPRMTSIRRRPGSRGLAATVAQTPRLTTLDPGPADYSDPARYMRHLEGTGRTEPARELLRRLDPTPPYRDRGH